MGNCIFMEAKPIRIMKSDGKILEYKSPTKVFQVLSDFTGHAIADAAPATHHLQQATSLLSGHLYFLVPTAAHPEKPPKKKKAVRFAEEPQKLKEEDDGDRVGRVVRIKVVVTKKELQEMVERGGMSAQEMICKMKSGSCEEISTQEFDDIEDLHKWKPVLQTIPETEVPLC